MIRRKKHIAFFLFVIFFFPITFQSLHIVWHHAHGYKGRQHLFSNATHNEDSSINKENISEKEKLCPIGEYQFSINDLPEFSIFRSVIPAFAFHFDEIIIQQQYKQFFSDKTPRAPPILNS